MPSKLGVLSPGWGKGFDEEFDRQRFMSSLADENQGIGRTWIPSIQRSSGLRQSQTVPFSLD